MARGWMGKRRRHEGTASEDSPCGPPGRATSGNGYRPTNSGMTPSANRVSWSLKTLQGHYPLLSPGLFALLRGIAAPPAPGARPAAPGGHKAMLPPATASSSVGRVTPRGIAVLGSGHGLNLFRGHGGQTQRSSEFHCLFEVGAGHLDGLILGVSDEETVPNADVFPKLQVPSVSCRSVAIQGLCVAPGWARGYWR